MHPHACPAPPQGTADTICALASRAGYALLALERVTLFVSRPARLAFYSENRSLRLSLTQLLPLTCRSSFVHLSSCRTLPKFLHWTQRPLPSNL